jgi:hypothetical protein
LIILRFISLGIKGFVVPEAIGEGETADVEI